MMQTNNNIMWKIMMFNNDQTIYLVKRSNDSLSLWLFLISTIVPKIVDLNDEITVMCNHSAGKVAISKDGLTKYFYQIVGDLLNDILQ